MSDNQEVSTPHETFETVRAWCDDTFGPATPESIINRAWEEWQEMLAAKDDDSRTIEAVDVVIILCRMPGFVEAFQRKMGINRARKWRLTGNGTGYHIPRGTADDPQPITSSNTESHHVE